MHHIDEGSVDTGAGVSIQSQFIPDGICYGCGPMNPAGLRLSSYHHNGAVVAEWQPQQHHAAVPGILCGGVIGTLIDCHSGAALAQAVHDSEGAWPWADSPGWVTSSYAVQMVRPTPVAQPVRLVSLSVVLDGDDAEVIVELSSGGKLTATGRATWRRRRAR